MNKTILIAATAGSLLLAGAGVAFAATVNGYVDSNTVDKFCKQQGITTTTAVSVTLDSGKVITGTLDCSGSGGTTATVSGNGLNFQAQMGEDDNSGQNRFENNDDQPNGNTNGDDNEDRYGNSSGSSGSGSKESENDSKDKKDGSDD